MSRENEQQPLTVAEPVQEQTTDQMGQEARIASHNDGDNYPSADSGLFSGITNRF